MKGRAKAESVSEHCEGIVGGCQAVSGICQTHMLHVLPWSESRKLAERPAENRIGHAHTSRQCLQVHSVAIFLVENLDRHRQCLIHIRAWTVRLAQALPCRQRLHAQGGQTGIHARKCRTNALQNGIHCRPQTGGVCPCPYHHSFSQLSRSTQGVGHQTLELNPYFRPASLWVGPETMPLARLD